MVDLRKYVPIRDVATKAFADGASARIGRMISINARAPQQWIADDRGPEEVVARLQAQAELVDANDPRARIEAIVLEMQQAGLEDEVIASFLSSAYAKLTGIKVR